MLVYNTHCILNLKKIGNFSNHFQRDRWEIKTFPPFYNLSIKHSPAPKLTLLVEYCCVGLVSNKQINILKAPQRHSFYTFRGSHPANGFLRLPNHKVKVLWQFTEITSIKSSYLCKSNKKKSHCPIISSLEHSCCQGHECHSALCPRQRSIS